MIFGIIFIYLAIQLLIYFNSEQLAVYEVTQNQIADDNTYQGLVLRDETIITSNKTGYINYYVGEGQRVGKNSTVYTVDQTGEMYNLLSTTEQEEALTSDDISEMRKAISTLQTNYTGSNYKEVYSYKYNVENTALELTNINMLTTLNKLLEANGHKNAFEVVKTVNSGIVSYFQDGFEDVTVENITESMFNTSEYKKVQLRTTEQKEANEPVYKLVTSETWSIVVELNDSQYETLKDKTSVRVTFLEDKQKANANFSVFEKDGKQYGLITLSNFMMRYLSERYIDIEIGVNSATGYKVPKSAVTEKEYYKVPLAFFTKGGDNNNTGIVKISYSENGEEKTQFIETTKFYEDEDFGYIDTTLVNDKDVIVNPASTGLEQEKYQISETSAFLGVYNVNKGYPVFKRIEVLYENEEYYLLKTDTSNGVNNFDHIILNVSLAEELKYVD